MTDHQQFTRDMTAAGYRVVQYSGRNCWKGPAVAGDDPEKLMAATSVTCQKDQLGKGYVVYPRAEE